MKNVEFCAVCLNSAAEFAKANDLHVKDVMALLVKRNCWLPNEPWWIIYPDVKKVETLTAADVRKSRSIFHTYENGPLTDGWDCVYCAKPFDIHGQHVEHPAHPGLAFCREECATEYLTRESRKGSSQPGQVGLAF